jgi:hypothetical protein
MQQGIVTGIGLRAGLSHRRRDRELSPSNSLLTPTVVFMWSPANRATVVPNYEVNDYSKLSAKVVLQDVYKSYTLWFI